MGCTRSIEKLTTYLVYPLFFPLKCLMLACCLCGNISRYATCLLSTVEKTQFHELNEEFNSSHDESCIKDFLHTWLRSWCFSTYIEDILRYFRSLKLPQMSLDPSERTWFGRYGPNVSHKSSGKKQGGRQLMVSCYLYLHIYLTLNT